MLIGPFSDTDMSAIEELLEANSIAFEVVITEKAIAEATDNKTHGGRYFSKMAKPIMIEIADSDFSKIAGELEKYGVVASDSDGSFELGEDE